MFAYISKMMYFCIVLEIYMYYIDFYRTFSHFGCFDINQVKLVEPSFDRTALTRWVKKGYLVQLRNGIYAFREWVNTPNAHFTSACFMYRPSYITGYSALAYYGMIPEFVAHITCATTLKTCSFTNDLGIFVYQHIKPELFVGYALFSVVNQRSFYIASPEKALIDLLYLNPNIKSVEDMIELRLDEDYMTEDFDWNSAEEYLSKIKNKSLNVRFNNLIKAYRND